MDHRQNPFTIPAVHEVIDLAKLMQNHAHKGPTLCQRLVRAAQTVQTWERLVAQALALDPGPVRDRLLVQNAEELGRAKAELRAIA